MTAINIIRKHDAVHMLTDGLSLSPSGDSFVLSKVSVMPHANAVMTIRGPALLLNLLTLELQARQSFDELKRTVRPSMESILAASAAWLKDSVTTGVWVQVVIAGWPDDGGPPEAFMISNEPRGIQAWQLVELGELSMAPGDADIEARFWASVFERNPHCQSVQDLDPEKDGALLLEAQRSALGDLDHLSMPIVGGFAQLTTVRRDEILTKIVRDWR